MLLGLGLRGACGFDSVVGDFHGKAIVMPP